jgi:hypothetical protein
LKYLLRYCFVLIFGLMMMEVRAQSTLPADFICCQTLVSGDVQLTWGASAEACGPFVEYQIWASDSAFAGPGCYVSSIGNYTRNWNNNLSHMLMQMEPVTTWYYYIVAVYTCAGFTMTSSDTLDNLDPVAPEIDLVTVTGGLSVLTWTPSTSPETNSYNHLSAIMADLIPLQLFMEDLPQPLPILPVYRQQKLKHIPLRHEIPAIIWGPSARTIITPFI